MSVLNLVKCFFYCNLLKIVCNKYIKLNLTAHLLSKLCDN